MYILRVYRLKIRYYTWRVTMIHSHQMSRHPGNVGCYTIFYYKKTLKNIFFLLLDKRLYLIFIYDKPSKLLLLDKYLGINMIKIKGDFLPGQLIVIPSCYQTTNFSVSHNLPFLDLAPIFSFDGQAICVFVSSMICNKN